MSVTAHKIEYCCNLRRFQKALAITKLNLLNLFNYGLEAPLYHERVWVPPGQIKKTLGKTTRITLFGTKHVLSGSVIQGDWDFYAVPFKTKHSFKRSWNHWVKGLSWEMGVYENKMASVSRNIQSDGCYNYRDVVKRYDKLDMMFMKVRTERRFRTQEELDGKKRYFARGKNEVEIFIDRYGNPIHGCGGNHRLSIAKILDIPIIPATLGAVHPGGIKHLHKYRNKNRIPR